MYILPRNVFFMFPKSTEKKKKMMMMKYEDDMFMRTCGKCHDPCALKFVPNHLMEALDMMDHDLMHALEIPHGHHVEGGPHGPPHLYNGPPQQMGPPLPVFGPPLPVFGPPHPVFGPPMPVFGSPLPPMSFMGPGLIKFNISTVYRVGLPRSDNRKAFFSKIEKITVIVAVSFLETRI